MFDFIVFIDSLSNRIRDKYDELGRVIRNFGDSESGNATFSEGLINYAKAMTLIADLKDIEVQRMQSKVRKKKQKIDENPWITI